MPTPRGCRHQSVTRTPPNPPRTSVNAASCDLRPGAPDLWHRPDGRIEVRAVGPPTPATLVQLASACSALRQAGHQPVLRADDAAVREYVWRCACVAVVHPAATVEPPMVMAPGGAPRHRASPLLLDVTRLATRADLPALLDQILGVLRQRLRYRPDDACDVTTAVSELCQNIFDHNVQACGFVAMQVTGRTGHRRLEIGVADDGAGLAATLRRNPRYAPVACDHEAIQLAVQRGTSAYADPTRGTGLYHLLKLVARQAGGVEIRSGAATIRYQRDQARASTTGGPWLPGVHVTLTLPTPGG